MQMGDPESEGEADPERRIRRRMTTFHQEHPRKTALHVKRLVCNGVQREMERFTIDVLGLTLSTG